MSLQSSVSPRMTKNSYAVKHSSTKNRKTKIKQNLCTSVKTFVTQEQFATFVTYSTTVAYNKSQSCKLI